MSIVPTFPNTAMLLTASFLPASCPGFVGTFGHWGIWVSVLCLMLFVWEFVLDPCNAALLSWVGTDQEVMNDSMVQVFKSCYTERNDFGQI